MARQLDEYMLVDGQIDPGAVAGLKEHGVTLIVNNRPDGEDEGQPTSAEIEAAATAAGLAYRHVPIARGMGPSDIEAMRDAMHSA
ncbi:MAG: sulfur transferase domain-containing protein, partial [Pseudomonadota bacterium]|nr:sulfur transferase domain-containing protein [Pseudomonadota bacterium]